MVEQESLFEPLPAAQEKEEQETGNRCGDEEVSTMELDPVYVDVIVRRWQEFTGGTATLEGSDKTFDEIAKQREKAAR